MTAFVPDASVAIAWVHPAQATAQTERMLTAIEHGATLEAPSSWSLEVANALLVLTRRKKLTEEQRLDALAMLRRLPVRLDHDAGSLAWSTLSELAAKHGLSVYDAVYIEFAERRQLPLGCKDGPLRTAAKARGIRLWTGD